MLQNWVCVSNDKQNATQIMTAALLQQKVSPAEWKRQKIE
jgi:hypothetical protein